MSHSSIQAQIAEEAADWAIKLDAGQLSANGREAFAAWLKQSPLHVEEMLLVTSLYQGIGLSDPLIEADYESASTDHIAEIVNLRDPRLSAPSNSNAGAKSISYFFESKAKLAMSVAAGFILLPALVFLALPNLKNQSPSTSTLTASTEIGELSVHSLDDGSVIHVNTQSKLSANISGESRTVVLLDGEAFFDVAKDQDRPFRVVAGDMVIEAIGTEFNVQTIGDRLVVDVAEGVVDIAPLDFGGIDARPGRMSGRTRVQAGQSSTSIGASSKPDIRDIVIENVAAWRTRRLIFQDETLASIAAEFNRYNLRKIVISGKNLADQRFTGVFAQNDPQSFIDYLKLTDDVYISVDNETIQVRERLQ